MQLLRLRPAFEGCQVTYATVLEGYRVDVGEDADFRVIPDANRSTKLALLHSAWSIFRLVYRLRPEIVISTGAAPGYLAIMFGRWLGARTIWVDSIANAEELSMSGQKAGKLAHLWLTQWPHLAGEGGPQFKGSVLG